MECAKCGENPEDVLILTCGHDLCLDCAAINLHDQEQKQQNSYATVICEMKHCNMHTALDPESAIELMEIY